MKFIKITFILIVLTVPGNAREKSAIDHAILRARQKLIGYAASEFSFTGM